VLLVVMVMERNKAMHRAGSVQLYHVKPTVRDKPANIESEASLSVYIPLSLGPGDKALVDTLD